MARIRYLKPDFFRDEDLADLTFWIRLLYAGLWNIADKEGRLEDRPKRIKIDIFPYDNVDIAKGLTALANTKNSGRPYIQRYEIEGEHYIQILKWLNHQKPHHTEKASEIPPAPPYLKDKGEGKAQQGELEKGNGELTVKRPLVFPFDDFWKQYPSRVGKKDALKHFNTTVKTEKDYEDIQKALRNYLLSDNVSKGYVQNGSTWMNNWRDWVDNPKSKVISNVSSGRSPRGIPESMKDMVKMKEVK